MPASLQEDFLMTLKGVARAHNGLYERGPGLLPGLCVQGQIADALVGAPSPLAGCWGVRMSKP